MEESQISVRSEIDPDIRTWRDSACYLDVESDLTIRAIGPGRSVLPSVNQNRLNMGLTDLQSSKIRIKIRFSVAATQLNEGNCLALAVKFRREII